MTKYRNRQQRLDLLRTIVARGGHRHEAEYILGTLRPKDFPVSDRVKTAKVIWDGGGTLEDVVKALTP